MNNIRDEKLLKRFGLRVKELREKRGWSQETLANEANVPVSQIGRIERGEVNTTISTLSVLAITFNVPLREIVNF